jgi:hypothetical protein
VLCPAQSNSSTSQQQAKQDAMKKTKEKLYDLDSDEEKLHIGAPKAGATVVKVVCWCCVVLCCVVLCCVVLCCVVLCCVV